MKITCPHLLRVWLEYPADKPWKVRHTPRLLPCMVNGPHDIHQTGGKTWR